MKHLDSSIARLMMAVATVAVGLMAMKTQADAWLGSLATIVVGWLILATVECLAGRRWVFWGGFVGVALVSLGISFGPWSDRDIRGGLPQWPNSTEAWLARLQPVSQAIYRMGIVVYSGARSRIVALDNQARPQVVATVVAPSWREDDRGLARSFMDDLLHASRIPPLPLKAGYLADEQAFDIALDAGHLLASLAFGILAGLTLAGLARLRRRRVVVGTE